MRAPVEEPSTSDELRTVRRWLIAVAIWALGASVVGAIAIASDDVAEQPRSPTLGLSTRISELEDKLERRIGALEDRVGGSAAASDLGDLKRDVDQAGDNADRAVKAARDLNDGLETLQGRLSRLEDRIAALEASPAPEAQP